MPAEADTGEPIFLRPAFVPKVWGGTRLRELCNLPPGDEPIGECLVISAHPDHDSVVAGGRFDGRTLSSLWSEHPHLFGHPDAAALPVQIKLIDADDDLSVQVHPDDTYAVAHGAPHGKSECWYVLSPGRRGEIVIGHHASTREQVAGMVAAGEWSALLRIEPMDTGDFFDIPAGTLHCLLGGSLVYEVLQASDVTYRLYDHDRPDLDGSFRELHVEEALDVVTAPDPSRRTAPALTVIPGLIRTHFIRNEHFSVSRWDVDERARTAMDAPYLLVSAIGGTGTVNGREVRKGDHFVIPSARRIELSGTLSLMVTSP